MLAEVLDILMISETKLNDSFPEAQLVEPNKKNTENKFA